MKKIVVIEDNLEVRENLVEILELAGYQCRGAKNGKEGVRFVREDRPDLILCDVMMPELDGFGVLKILSNDPQLIRIPFMFLTAKTEKEDFRRGMGLGADDYITKPFNDVELLQAIEIRLQKAEALGTTQDDQNDFKQFFDYGKGEEKWKSLFTDCESRNYPRKTTIYAEGQYPKYLYFIHSGQVKCQKTNDFGKELILKVYGVGDSFGYLPLLAPGPYDHSIIAIEDVKVSLIPKQDFLSVLHNDKDFAAYFITLLAYHASSSDSNILDMAYSSVRKKVANALLALHKVSNKGQISVMREEIAAFAGTAKETTIRTLTDFKNEGLITVESRHISINDLTSLETMPQ